MDEGFEVRLDAVRRQQAGAQHDPFTASLAQRPAEEE